MTSLPSRPLPFDTMIAKSQKRRYHKYDAVYLAIEDAVASHPELRTFWRSLDRRARATAAAAITKGTASTASPSFETDALVHIRERLVISSMQPRMEVENVD